MGTPWCRVRLADPPRSLADRTVVIEPKTHDAVGHEVADEQMSARTVDHPDIWSTAPAVRSVEPAQRRTLDRKRGEVASVGRCRPAAGIEHAPVGMHGQVERIAHGGGQRDRAGPTGQGIEREAIDAAALPTGVAPAEVGGNLDAKRVGERADEDVHAVCLAAYDPRAPREPRRPGAQQRSSRNASHKGTGRYHRIDCLR